METFVIVAVVVVVRVMVSVIVERDDAVNVVYEVEKATVQLVPWYVSSPGNTALNHVHSGAP